VGVERVQRELGLTVHWVPFPLHPETPTEGRSLETLFSGTGMDIGAMRARLRSVASGLGLALGDRSHTYNSRLAQELGEWAEQRGLGDAFRAGAYRAYFADGANLALPDVLVAVADAAGLPADEARMVVTERSFSATVDAHWQRAIALGVRAVPTHHYRGATATGYHPHPELRRFLLEHGAAAQTDREQPR
jgi:predicted DsbA family dithiol-disulfide isomerase